MKKLTNYIQESASVFHDLTTSYGDPVLTYTEYSEGDLKFGDVKSGDTLHYWDNDLDNVIELTATSEIKALRGNYFISVKNENNSSQNKVMIGSVNGRYISADHKYDPNTVKDMSISVGLYKPVIVGTNRDTVLKLAKSNITKIIEDLSRKLEQVQNDIDTFKKKLESII